MADPRICIIGAGALSTRRIYPYMGAAGAELVGVCDLDAVKAQTNARRFGGKAYTDMDAMLDAEKSDGVIVCIGPAAHPKFAMHVLKRGLPVYTEKPPAATAADALAVARVAQETGLLCTTAFKKRYTAAADRATQWLQQFDPADRLSISVDYASAAYKLNPDRPHHTFLLDFTVHIIDLVRYLFGEVTQVFAFARGGQAYAVSMRFDSGAVGSMNLTDGRSFQVPTEEIELTVSGGNFMTISNSSRWRITENGKPGEWREPPTFTSSGDSGMDTGHLAELIDYVNALREGRTTTRSSIESGYRTMVLYEAIDASAKTGRIIDVKYETV